MNKEQWKDDVLSSLNSLKKAEPGPFLFTRISARLNEAHSLVRPYQLKWVAISLMVLMVLNGWALRRTAEKQDFSQDEYSISSFQAY